MRLPYSYNQNKLVHVALLAECLICSISYSTTFFSSNQKLLLWLNIRQRQNYPGSCLSSDSFENIIKHIMAFT